jgi:hypothetical protein
MVRKTRKTNQTRKTSPFKPLTVAALKVGRPIKVWERQAFVTPAPPPKSTRDFDVHYTFTPTAKPHGGRIPGTFKSANIAGWTGLSVSRSGLVSSNLDNTEAYIRK